MPKGDDDEDIVLGEDEEDETPKQKKVKKSKKEASDESSPEDTSSDEEDKPRKKAKSDTAAKKNDLPITLDKDDLFACELSSKKFCKVRMFKNNKYVDFREYYEKEGNMLPGKKGLMLNRGEWESIKKNMAAIDKAFSST